jgi:hypothetical protein
MSRQPRPSHSTTRCRRPPTADAGPIAVRVAAARWMLVLTLALSGAGCGGSEPAPEPAASGDGGWLSGTADDKFDTIARQLRGFDMAMVETGYRYNELYWAVQDGNWSYAEYQVAKIRTAVENGLERRPKRATSAETFLTLVLPALAEAIAGRDMALAQDRLVTLRSTCNTCHEAEVVEFVHVGVPQTRSFTAAP